LTEKVAHDYHGQFARLSLVPSSGGVFEVRVGGREVYSKKATGQFPDETTLLAEIGQLAGNQM
jgi:selenoprotein W-related protein